MHIYYVAGVPYSDDLYHSGVKGMKWGVRRYQYEDGTLTPLGKVHYSAQKVGRAVSTAAKKLGTHAVDKFKDKHKWLMSDEELERKTIRANKEKQYKDLLAANKNNKKSKQIIGSILENGAKTLGRAVFDKKYNEIVNGPDKNSPSYKFVKEFTENFDTDSLPSYDDIKRAADYSDALRRVEGKGGGKKKGGG